MREARPRLVVVPTPWSRATPREILLGITYSSPRFERNGAHGATRRRSLCPPSHSLPFTFSISVSLTASTRRVVDCFAALFATLSRYSTTRPRRREHERGDFHARGRPRIPEYPVITRYHLYRRYSHSLALAEAILRSLSVPPSERQSRAERDRPLVDGTCLREQHLSARSESCSLFYRPRD